MYWISWDVYIDTDNNLSTGGHALDMSDIGYEIQMGVRYPGEPFAEGFFWSFYKVFNETTRSWVWSEEFYPIFYIEGNTVVISAFSAWEGLTDIDQNFRFEFLTYYHEEDKETLYGYVVDKASGNGNSTVTDPVGDLDIFEVGGALHLPEPPFADIIEATIECPF